MHNATIKTPADLEAMNTEVAMELGWMSATTPVQRQIIEDLAHDLTVPSIPHLERRCGRDFIDSKLDLLAADMGNVDEDANADTAVMDASEFRRVSDEENRVMDLANKTCVEG